MKTFTEAIADHIDAVFPNGETMTKYDFTDVAESFGKPCKSITHVLRAMEERGGLRIVGELKNVHGGSSTKKYARIPGAQLVPPADYRTRYHEDYQREIREKEVYANECGVRLHEVLDGMTMVRLSCHG